MIFFDDLSALNKQQPIALPYATLGGMQRVQSSIFKFTAHTMAESTEQPALQFSAMSDAVNLAPGMRITMSNHPDAEFNKTYRILSAAYQGQQLAGENSSDLHNESQLPLQCELCLIPAAEAFIPAVIDEPRYAYTQFAQVESEQKHAQLDADGQYKIRFPFSEEDYAKTQASPYVSHLQQLGGLQQGMSHPHLDGTIVAIGYAEGNISTPIILGAVPSSTAGSLVAGANKTQHILRSQSGHEFNLDDNKTQPSIQLNSSQQDNQLQMSSKEGQSMVQLQSRGDLFLQSQLNLHREVSATHSQHIGADMHAKVNKQSSVVTQKGGQHLSSGQKNTRHKQARYPISQRKKQSPHKQQQNTANPKANKTSLSTPKPKMPT